MSGNGRAPSFWRGVALAVLLLAALAAPSGAAEPLAISGTVADDQGSPVAGATIRVARVDLEQRCHGLRVGSLRNAGIEPRSPARLQAGGSIVATTDVAGRWRVEPRDLASGLLAALVSAPGFTPRLEAVRRGENPLVRLFRNGAVPVQLLGNDGQPQAGVRVELVPLSVCEAVLGELGSFLVASGTTDREGTVEWSALLPGSHLLRIEDGEAPGGWIGPLDLEPASGRYRLRPHRPEAVLLDLLSRPRQGAGGPAADATLRLLVSTLESGEPVVNDVLLLLASDAAPGPQVLFARIPAAGTEIRGFPGNRFRILATEPELLAMPPDLSGTPARSPDDGIALTVSTRATVRGEVTSAITGLALPGAEVELRSKTPLWFGGELARVTTSNDEGQWRLDGVPQGIYELTASAAGHLSETHTVTVRYSRDPVLHRIVLTGSGGIEGRIRGLEEGSSASVELGDLAHLGTVGNKVEVDDLGRFAFSGLRPGEYLVGLEVRGPASAYATRGRFVEVRAGETTQTEFDLERRIRLSGEVTLGTEAAAKARLLFDLYLEGEEQVHCTAVTDEQGEYEVAVPRPGPYRVRLDRAGAPLDGYLSITVEDRSPQEIDLPFASGRIEGRVVRGKQKREPVEDVPVWLSQTSGEPSSSDAPADRALVLERRTAADGSFAFGALGPGPYVVSVVPEGLTSRRIPVIVGRDQRVDLGEIVVEKGSVLVVQTLGPQGEPLRQAQVGALLGGGRNGFGVPPTAVSGPDGRARFDELGAGSYAIVGLYAGLAPAVVEHVEVPAEGAVPLRFERGGTLEIRLYAKGGSPLPGRRVQLVDAAGQDVTSWYEGLSIQGGSLLLTDREGVLRVAAMRPGRYLVRAVGDPSSTEDTVVIEGAVTTVALTVGP